MRWITLLLLLSSPFTIASDLAQESGGRDRVEELLAALDSEDFAKRQEASAALDAMGVDLLPRLRKIVDKIESFEAQTRCRRLIRDFEIDMKIAATFKAKSNLQDIINIAEAGERAGHYSLSRTIFQRCAAWLRSNEAAPGKPKASEWLATADNYDHRAFGDDRPRAQFGYNCWGSGVQVDGQIELSGEIQGLWLDNDIDAFLPIFFSEPVDPDGWHPAE